MIQIYFIYGLADPRNDKLYYVGVSKSPTHRLNQHMCHARKDNSCMAASEWIAELIRAGLKPEIVILEEYPSDWRPDVLEVERQWIDHCLNIGEPLVNRVRPRSHTRIHRWSNVLPDKEPRLKWDAARGWYYSHE